MKISIVFVCSVIGLLGSTSIYADSDSSEILNYVDLRLTERTRYNENTPVVKVFKDFNFSGGFSSDGDWKIKGSVSHSRLRCGTYQLGVQLGQGNPACLNVKWLTDISYGTRKTHCNSATLMHDGGGELAFLKSGLESATCVKIVTRCTGVCDN